MTPNPKPADKGKPTVSGWAVHRPQLPPALKAEDNYCLADDDSISGVELTGCNLDNQEARLVAFQAGRLVSCSFAGTDIDKARLINLELSKCDLSNSTWSQCKLVQVSAASCKILGAKWTESQWTDVVFTDSLGKLLQLYGSKLKHVIFENCRLEQADFRSCQLDQVRFANCNLTGAEFYGAKLNQVEFSGSVLDGIKANAGDLKGAIIDGQQLLQLAETLAGMLGIKVER
jgi:uncharacterized protein YjbI with pentapeptide repeats